MNIILIGFMGTGKTTTGKLLAKKINNIFIDLDEEIEKTLGLKISEIFERFGEKHFRDSETLQLKNVLSCNKCVLSTGGGIVLKEENIQLIKNNNFVVLLEASPEIIYERIKKEQTRPLLKVEDPSNKILLLLKERNNSYLKATDIKINTNNLTPEEIVEEIYNQLPKDYNADLKLKY